MTVTEMNPPSTQAAIEIEIADVDRLDAVAELFDQYRVFYGQTSNLPAARHFLFERMINHESVIYLALDAKTGQATGFVQLYPGFSSVTMEAQWILNDLYVAPAYRRQGIAKRLVQEAIDLVRARQDKGLLLETAPDNVSAQKLYESMGFKPDDTYRHYAWQR